MAEQYPAEFLWEKVTAIAPAVASLSEDSQQAILAVVFAQVNPATWGDLLDAGRRYLAAHLATLALRAASGGLGVASETVGPLSRTYITPKMLQGSFGQTAFGQEYQRLARLLPTALGCVP